MNTLSPRIESFLEKSSWIRRMFESGIEMKKAHGAENVFDFSLGNPDLPPPAAVSEAMKALADDIQHPLALGYMPNAGYQEVRERLAAKLAEEQQSELTADHLVLTCGAAGGINAFLRAVTVPGDEVLCPAPYFVEYGFYADNVGCSLKSVPAQHMTFDLDVDALDNAITKDTRALIINSPNNPTGAVYDEDTLKRLCRCLSQRSAEAGRPIYLVSDEPYRFLTYDDVTVPPILPLYPHSVVIGSFSKNLSLAGERVGYIAANPRQDQVDKLLAGVIMTNRILGFVNAPAIGQRLMAAALDSSVDVDVYRRRRDAMAKVLQDAGIAFTMPRGAFYFFPEAPGDVTDKTFVDLLMEQRVLAVPGSGFGYPGFFRLTFCVDEATIKRSAEGFKRAADKARQS